MTSKVAGAGTQGAEGAIAPIVVSLGKARRSRIKKLKKGEGPLMAEVDEVMQQVRASLGDRAGIQLVPVVLVYQKKPKNRRVGLFGV